MSTEPIRFHSHTDEGACVLIETDPLLDDDAVVYFVPRDSRVDGDEIMPVDLAFVADILSSIADQIADQEASDYCVLAADALLRLVPEAE